MLKSSDKQKLKRSSNMCNYKETYEVAKLLLFYRFGKTQQFGFPNIRKVKIVCFSKGLENQIIFTFQRFGKSNFSFHIHYN